MTVTLRRARDDEGGELAMLLRASRIASSPAIPLPIHTEGEDRQWFQTEVLPKLEVWVAEADGMRVGVMVLGPGWVNHLYVLGGWTGRAIGTRLIELAKARQPDALELWTFQSNRGARRFYERHGFVPVEETDGSANEEGVPDVRYRWTASTSEP